VWFLGTIPPIPGEKMSLHGMLSLIGLGSTCRSFYGRETACQQTPVVLLTHMHLNIRTHTHTHTQSHTRIHTHTLTHTHTHTRIHTHANAHNYMHRYASQTTPLMCKSFRVLPSTRTRTRTCTHTHTRTHLLIHTSMIRATYIHTLISTYTHTHTHTHVCTKRRRIVTIRPRTRSAVARHGPPTNEIGSRTRQFS